MKRLTVATLVMLLGGCAGPGVRVPEITPVPLYAPCPDRIQAPPKWIVDALPAAASDYDLVIALDVDRRAARRYGEGLYHAALACGATVEP